MITLEEIVQRTGLYVSQSLGMIFIAIICFQTDQRSINIKHHLHRICMLVVIAIAGLVNYLSPVI